MMEAVVEHKNMLAALERVRHNKGSPGIDDMSTEDLVPYLKEQWPRIKKELLEWSYYPQAVREVEIPKPGSKEKRKLGIPTVLDRLIQQALHQVLSSLYEPEFSESSFGFRPGRSAHQAVCQARDYVAEGRRFVVDLDLEKFFDKVNHDVLMSRIARKVEDKRVLRLIRRYLESGVLCDGLMLMSQRTQGTPQGGPLSPILSNILLDDLDKELERRGHAFCRYGDDCQLYVWTKRSGERVMQSLTRYLEDRLKLRVNVEKSAVDRPWNRKFLGYTMTWHKKPRIKVAPESVKRLKGTILEVFRRGRGRSLQNTIDTLAPKLQGWINYFKLAEVKNVFEELDSWLRRKLRCILWRQWKRPYTRAKKLMQRGLGEMQSWKSATNGRGPWWNSGSRHMNLAFPKSYFDKYGLVSLLDQFRRMQYVK